MAVTREQVVQWQDAAVSKADKYEPDGPYYCWELVRDTEFATIARADLEATIAEQAKEIERLTIESGLWMIKAKGKPAPMADSVPIEQLQSSQAREAQLREALQAVVNEAADRSCGLKIADDALASPSDDTALREYGAKLVERIASEVDSFYPKKSLQEIADKIRKG